MSVTEKVEAICPVAEEGWRSPFGIGACEHILELVVGVAREQETCITKQTNKIELAEGPARQATQEEERK